MILPSQERRQRGNIWAALIVLTIAGALTTQLVRRGWPFTGLGDPDAPGAPATQAAAATAPAPAAAPAIAAPAALPAERAAPAGLATARAEVRALTRPAYAHGEVALDETRTAHVLAGVTGQVDRLDVIMVGKTVKAGERLCTVGGTPIVAPRAGVVVMKNATSGMPVEPTTELYTIADVSRMWVLAEVRAADLPYVHVGDRATLSIARQRGTFGAPIAFLATESSTRGGVKARFAVANPRGALRPGARVTAELPLALGTGLVVPASAVVRTDTRALVLVVAGRALVPREVVLGPETDTLVRVERGLAAGEVVALEAQALLDRP